MKSFYLIYLMLVVVSSHGKVAVQDNAITENDDQPANETLKNDEANSLHNELVDTKLENNIFETYNVTNDKRNAYSTDENTETNVVEKVTGNSTDGKKNEKLLETVDIKSSIEELRKRLFKKENAARDLKILNKLLETSECDEHAHCGETLILTPYIENRLFHDARQASKVNSSHFNLYESYSGFLTVDKQYNSNTFFWYFPVMTRSVSEAPCIIWLQGGPGASSLIGLLTEIGPLKLQKDGTLITNADSWLSDHSLLFIDNPVGTGFSYTEHEDGYAQDMDTYARHLYTAFAQLLQVYPELRAAPLFVAGESYGGKYAPALAAQIHDHMRSGDIIANLQGVIIGNGFVDASMLAESSRPLYNMGILSPEEKDGLQPILDEFRTLVAANQSTAANEKWKQFIVLVMTMTGQNSAHNFLKDDMDLVPTFLALRSFLQSADIQRALHVGSRPYSVVNFTVNYKLTQEFITSATPLYEKLLENNYRVLAYCGQLDQLLPCALESETYRAWRWRGAAAFRRATRHAVCPNTRMGYWKSGGNLTEVLVVNAGHMAAQDAPRATRLFVSAFTRRERPYCAGAAATAAPAAPGGNYLNL